MKVLLAILCLIFSTSCNVYYSEATHNNTCNPGILDTYNLEIVLEPVDTENYICPGIKHNCCTAESQHKIFQHWIQGHERDRLLHVYKTFIATFSLLFDDFKLVEQMANLVLTQKAPDAVTNCGEMASSIKEMSASGLKEQVINLAKKAYRFLYDSRRGFYCALCDADAHQHFNTLDGAIHISYGFCSSLIKETMGWYTFQYKYFNKIARLYGHFMSTCETNGVYDATHILKYSLKFFNQEDIIHDIDTCSNNLNDNSALGICHSYCEQFNPTTFSHLFEGQFEDLLGFRIWLNKQVVGKIYASLTGFSKDDLSFSGRLLNEENKREERLLAEAPAATPAAGGEKNSTTAKNAPKGHYKAKSVDPFDVYSSSVNQFNKKYNTQAIDPITYRASEDFSVTRLFTYEMSLFKTSKLKVYDFSHFRRILDVPGINFLKYGYMITLNHDTLEALNHELDLEDQIEFTNITDPLSPNYGYRNESIQYVH